MEALELRITPAVTVSVVDTGVTFQGDANDNFIKIWISPDGYLSHNLDLNPALAPNLVSNKDLDSSQPANKLDWHLH